jgi:hypothetical protein
MNVRKDSNKRSYMARTLLDKISRTLFYGEKKLRLNGSRGGRPGSFDTPPVPLTCGYAHMFERLDG